MNTITANVKKIHIGTSHEHAQNKILFALFSSAILFILLNNISPFGDSSQFKMHQIAFGALAIFTVLTTRIIIPHIIILSFFVCIIFTSIISFFFYPIDDQFVNLLYCAAALIIFTSSAVSLGKEKSLKACQIAFSIGTIAVIIKNVVIWDQIYSLLVLGYRAFVYGLISGGPNQEGSWLALGAAFFWKKKGFWPYLFITLAINIVYTSRGGLIIFMIFMTLHILTSKNASKVIIGAFIALLISAFFTYLYIADHTTGISLLDRIIGRALNTHDMGTVGRIKLSEGALEALLRNPFGYGASNGVWIINILTGHNFIEGNVHNIYLQFFLDGGVQSLFLYMMVFCYFISRNFRTRFRDPFLIFVLMYLIVGFFRFRGYDIMAFSVMGMSEAIRLLQKRENFAKSRRSARHANYISRRGLQRARESSLA